MALQADVVEAVANGNFKTIGDTSSQFSNLILNDAVIAGRNMSAIREKSVARSLERMDVTNDDEGINAANTNVTLAALAQVLTKLAQSTPPETGRAGN